MTAAAFAKENAALSLPAVLVDECVRGRRAIRSFVRRRSPRAAGKGQKPATRSAGEKKALSNAAADGRPGAKTPTGSRR
jgi:hypothetical protein